MAKTLMILPIHVVHDRWRQHIEECLGRHTYFGDYRCRITNARIRLFATKGVKCAGCGVVGCYYSLDKHKRDGTPHLNLRTADNTLMTKDHIIPHSKGGANDRENYQTMCVKCNGKKADKYDGTTKMVSNEDRETAYVKNKGMKCPFCGKSSIEGSSIEIDGGIAWQDVYCTDCEAEWTDLYTLTGIQIRNHGNKKTD